MMLRKLSFGMFAGYALMFAPAFATCTASTSRNWVDGHTIEAYAQGPTCAQAVATLIIRRKSGEAIWAYAHVTSNLMNFTQSPAANAKALTAQLKDWISGNGFMKSADKLVTDSEFPFMLNEGVDAATFAKYRKAKLPMLCYIQGMESGKCVALDNKDGVIELGVQSFPG